MALGGSLAGTAKAVLTVDTGQFDRGLVEAQNRFHRTTNEIEHDAGRMGRGVLASSGAFEHLGRSLAFASGAFLGAAGFTEVVRGSIEAAEGLEKAHRQLDAQIEAGHESARAAQAGIEDLDRQMAQFGHTSVETEGALSRLVRATGDVADGEKLMGLAADLSAARHISLEQAALLVGKVFDGNVSALNRYGIRIEKGTSVTEALRTAQERLAGQAAAGVTPMERLHATVGNLEATLGTQLLPTINHIAGGLTKWLGNTQNQERVQRDLQKVIGTLGSVIKTTAGIVKTFTDNVGGAKNAMELLMGVVVLSKISGWANAFTGLIGTSTSEGGTGLKGTTRAAKLLRAELGFLAEINPIVIPITLAVALDKAGLSDPLGIAHIKDRHDIVGLLTGRKGALYNLFAGSDDGGVGVPGSAPQTGTRPAKNQGAAIAAVAQTQLGIPYQWGGPAILGAHTDCSGLAQAVLAKNGINIGRTTYVQWTQGRAVMPGDLQAGDLVFFHMGSRGPEHVGIYIGNNNFIHDPHTGDHVRVESLSNMSGFVGARRYTTDTASGGKASGFQHDPNTHTAPKPGAFEPVPKDLRLAYAEAAVTKDNADDLRVLRQIDDYLKERLKHEKNKNNRIQLLEAEKSTEDEIAALTKDPKKKDPRSPGAFDPIPKRLRLGLAEASLTKSNADDLRVLRKILDYLSERLKHTTEADRRIAIIDEITSARSQVASLTKTKKPDTRDPDALPVDLQQALAHAGTTKGARDDLRAFDDAIAFVERRLGQTGLAAKSRIKLEKLLKQLEDQRNKVSAPIQIAGLTRSLPRLPSIAGVTREMGDLSAGRSTTTLTIPGIGKILTAFSLTPTVGAWNKIIGQLKKKLIAAQKRLTALNRSLAKARKARFPNKTLIAWLTTQIAGIKTLIGTIKEDIGEALTEVAQLVKDAEDKAQQDADEAEKAATDADTAAEGGAANIPTDIQQALADADLTGDTGGRVAALGREATFLQGELASGTVTTADGRTIALTPEARVAVTSALGGVRREISDLTTPAATDPNLIPADLRLALVRAQGTPDTADDLAALRGQQSFVTGRINATTDPELLITLTGSLNDINDQIGRLVDGQKTVVDNQVTQIDQAAQFQEFFTGLRGLRGFESDILGAALGGSLIQVTNYFAQGPEDPHTFSAGVSFELRALVG